MAGRCTTLDLTFDLDVVPTIFDSTLLLLSIGS